MLQTIIHYSLKHKLINFLFVAALIVFGIYALMNIPIGAVPDITNNQVQVITTSRNLATEDVEKYLTYPVELEMANLPGVKEIRSISKFGLSVVTIVFEENQGTYLPRQLIAEKLKSAEEKIPKGFGIPFMGPITTGLGEIYQYVLDVKPAYKERYSTTDLRTIQDWIVKRQLSGIPGVVEVNTWGGYLKTYEVAIDPARLRAINLSITEVYEAMSRNNGLAGGGYIEKNNESYFIRAEGLVSTLEEIGNIVVDNRDGIPIYIKDVAKVKLGHATRFGAITGNGEGEKVLGQIMMLKNASSKAVINAVQKKVASIQSSLPEGIMINPILDRSHLVKKTTVTISENLILGCLIVILVVILLLGNLRSALVVASVIPLSLIFAISLMYIFDLDANLMSLGAIDFGIIIDGAVIIVEYIAFNISREIKKIGVILPENRRSTMDKITEHAAAKMMRSAVFGQLIIIIVFIPILSLSGVEGKMFRPMALTFSFALIGTMILCLTYVPMMCALFIKPDTKNKKNISDRLMLFLQRLYQPVIKAALNARSVVLGMAVILILVAVFLFSRMGGEFIPTLDEGDFVIQPVLKTGMSLDKTIEMTTRMEKIIKRFPEVNQIASRIGAAEVPTDPMSMEESDVIITLHAKKHWVTAKSKDALADTMKAAIEAEIPNVEVEFTQPIEMRFNELITGVRADLAIKLFGDDLDLLYKKAIEIKNAIDQVPGAADITVEKTEGLPQMTVKYDRRKIAQYGLNIEELNNIVSMGFAGLSAGIIFEGERQFDLVIKYDEANRKDIRDLSESLVKMPNGQQMPLSTFASVQYTTGPAKISRDNTKRRIVVGVNVRGRDLQSVVRDIQTIIQSQVKLPHGYLIEYGGQFENLQSAMKRLMIAVPIALVLIFLMLYFAFDSFRDAMIIYSAIPLSAVGGVLLLYIRDMPFSISAGVGFIALFGIAVLNGIVLIEYFKELKSHGMHDIHEMIVVGTTNRMRPVLLTASAAALGFLPMAISTSAGAEVQRPLATVVIGGLITATLLTLIVLPVLYSLLEVKKRKKKAINILPLIFLLVPVFMSGQTITLEQAIQIAGNNNLGLKSASLEVQKTQALLGNYLDVPKTGVYWGYDHNNLTESGDPLHVVGISQSFKLPGVYAAQKKLNQQQATSSETRLVLQKEKLTHQVTAAYMQAVYFKSLIKEYHYLDSLLSRFQSAAIRKTELGETNHLESLTAQSKYQANTLKLIQAEGDLGEAKQLMKYYLNTTDDPEPVEDSLTLLAVLPKRIEDHSLLVYENSLLDLAQAAQEVTIKHQLPDINLSVFNGINFNNHLRSYPGFTAGLSVPLWKQAYKSNTLAASKEIEIRQNEIEKNKNDLIQYQNRLTSQLAMHRQAIDKYTQQIQPLQGAVIQSVEKSFQQGEIDFFQYILTLENNTDMKMNYLYHVYKYNQTVIELNFLINPN